METRHDFRLNFISNQNEIKAINVPRADAAATGAQVSDAMQAIIDSGVVQSARGEPLFHHSAELISTNRQDFNVLV